MNNPGGVVDYFPFQFRNSITVDICISNKIHFQQRIVQLFGLQSLQEILNSPQPVILPILDYTRSFNVIIFILL